MSQSIQKEKTIKFNVNELHLIIKHPTIKKAVQKRYLVVEGLQRIVHKQLYRSG